MAKSYSERLKKLEKENAELKLQLEVAGQRIDTLSSTNINLSNQIENLNCTIITLAESLKQREEQAERINVTNFDVIKKLKAQIGKMKPYCKCLCKNYSKFSAMGNDCVNGVCRNCEKWELAE